MRRSDSGRPTLDTRLSNWRKNFILIATWHAVGGSKLHMPCVWRSDRSRSGSKIGGWSGKRSTKWPPWMPCRCIKCILLWHISTILTYRPWACTSLDLNTLTLQRASSIDTVFINNCYEQNKQTNKTNERPKLQRTNKQAVSNHIITHLYYYYTNTNDQTERKKKNYSLLNLSPLSIFPTIHIKVTKIQIEISFLSFYWKKERTLSINQLCGQFMTAFFKWRKWNYALNFINLSLQLPSRNLIKSNLFICYKWVSSYFLSVKYVEKGNFIKHSLFVFPFVIEVHIKIFLLFYMKDNLSFFIVWLGNYKSDLNSSNFKSC